MIAARGYRRLVPGLIGVLLFAAGIASAVPATAQVDPAAAVLQELERRAEEIDRQTRPRQEGDPVLVDPLQRAELPPPGGPTVLLKQVRFEPPSAFLTEAELAAIAERYVGKRVDFRQIASLVRDVNDLYADRGIVTASAILPPQELADGVLLVQLVEGQVGAVGILGERRTKDKFILDRITLTRGVNVVDVPAAAKDILRFNATHRAQIRMLLQPGASFGLTDIVLGVTEPPPELLQFYIDNAGVESTGAVQVNALYRKYGMLGIDDSLMLFASGAQGSLAGTISYDLPVGTWGTRLAMGYTTSGIRIVAGPTAVLDVTGASQAATATLTHPLFVEAQWTAQWLASISYGLNSSVVSDVTIVDSDTTKLATGLMLAHTAEWGAVSVQPQLVYARAHDRLADSWRDILLLTGSATALYRLSSDVSLVGRASWQYTEAELLPGDLLFQIGGPTTVRGYPSTGVAGDSGYFAQVELRLAPPSIEGLEAFAFSDVGEVFSTFPDRTTLLSAGIGVSYAFNDVVSVDATVALPLLDAMPDQSTAVVYGRVTTTLR